jgi:hypothetical protein
MRFYLQQDGAPLHYHRDVRVFLDEHLTNRSIGISSPQCISSYGATSRTRYTTENHG